MKYHRLGGLRNGNLFPHSSGDPKSKIKVPDIQFLVRAYSWLADGWLAVFSHGLSSVLVQTDSKNILVLDQGLSSVHTICESFEHPKKITIII